MLRIGAWIEHPHYGLGKITNHKDTRYVVAFQVGILSGDVGRGAAISLYFFPFLLVATFFLLRYLRRREI